MTAMRNENGTFPAYAFPGGYPIFYICADGGVLCPGCANKEDVHEHAGASHCPDSDGQWCIVGSDIHWEGAPLTCDNCNAQIESAYGDDEDEREATCDECGEPLDKDCMGNVRCTACHPCLCCSDGN